MSPPMKAVIFDNGKVLVNTDWDLVARLVAESLDVPVESGETFRQARLNTGCYGHGTPRSDTLWNLYSRGASYMTSEQFWRIILEYNYGLNPTMERISAMQSAMRRLITEPNLPAIHLIKELKKASCRVYMLSNAVPEMTEGSLVQEYYRLMDSCYISWQTGYRKPDRKAWEHLLREEGLCPSQCFFVDDKKENIEAAESLGIRSLLYRVGDNISELRKALLLHGC